MVWIEKSVTRVTDWHHETCRVMPNNDPECRVFLSTIYTDEGYFLLHTFWFITFDFLSRTCYKVTLFPLKSLNLSLKKSTLPATAVQFITLTSNLHKVTSFWRNGCKIQRHLRCRYVNSYTTYAFKIHVFYPVLGDITCGYPYLVCKKRIVSPGKTRGYSYPVCKKSQLSC